MPKLHELLAVNGSLENQAKKCLADLKKLFAEKPGHFTSRDVQTIYKDPNVPTTVDEHQDIQTDVFKELKWVSEFEVKAVDSSHQVNVGNMSAKADIVMEDQTILIPAVPATTLLELEKTVTEWKSVVSVIPTLDPAKGFKPDESQGKGRWKSREIRRTKTAKKNVPIVLHAPTVEHPAQTQMVIEDVPVGDIITQEWSSMITPEAKADLLNRCETLIRAIKKARSKANEVEVDSGHGNRIGQRLWDFMVPPAK